MTVESPGTEILGSEIFSDDRTATSVLSGMYSKMMRLQLAFSSGSITAMTGLSGDEFDNYDFSTSSIEFADNALTPQNTTIVDMWNYAYNLIYTTNKILEDLPVSEKVSTETKSQLIGEALFIRSLCYYYLATLWGDVPLILSSDYRLNMLTPRTPVRVIFETIAADLAKAQESMAKQYVTNSRVRPNSFAAKALLARIHLYLHNWDDAIQNAVQVLNQNDFYQLDTSLLSVFKIESKETIWQLMPVTPNFNTSEGNAFILIRTPSWLAMKKDLVDAFEVNDERRKSWIGIFVDGSNQYYFPFKYREKENTPLTEYYKILRLAELHLILSEAYLQKDDFKNSTFHINKLRERAKASLLPEFTNKEEGTQALLNEYRLEFFCEWGQRWLTLKRLGKIDEILSLTKPLWENTDALFPIPATEIVNNPNLTQNPGYN